MKQIKSYFSVFFYLVIFVSGIVSCTAPETYEEPKKFTANISALNSEANNGRSVTGSATFLMEGDELKIRVQAQGLAPNMMHMQHLHSFKDGHEAKCPPPAEADKNNDGVIDLIETHDYSGVTRIPLHDNPKSLKIESENYPTSDAEGNLNYQITLRIDSLRFNFRQEYMLDSLLFEKQVLFIHGVNPETDLPETAQSLPGVPAHATLPVGCGKLELQTTTGEEVVNEMAEDELPLEETPRAL